ncbi:MAG: acetyl-CoA hydrolase/transferase family protein, partial [Firmicutes bacterium]|nr:acetyl-CoA hydrolase/transferase family protein [Bacillota bacterium]
MNWRELYRQKLTPVEEAVKVVCSGDRVAFSHCAGEPLTLSKALVERAPYLENVTIIHFLMLGPNGFCNPGMEKHFSHISLFTGASARDAVNSGKADFIPCFFAEVPRLFREGYLPVDRAFIHLSPPDEHGFMSFGVAVDYTKIAASVARTVVAAVNPSMPRTLGDSFIHVSEVDYIVEIEEPVIEVPLPEIGPVEESIGRHVASLIEDGATLQLGIGAIPDATLKFLTNKIDLGIHTEMFSDGVVDLVEAGVITNEAKSIHRGKLIATFLMGTRRLYDFVHDNPAVEMHTVDYTNDPFVIGQNSKIVSINSAIQVDLTGQICADSIGFTHYSGVGGQVDFVRGAARSPGGKSIIVLPSTAMGGQVSRISVALSEGAGVTTTRNDIHYVVTEYGIADLRGKSFRQRAEALITIAHPDFRCELSEGIKAKRSIVIPAAVAEEPAQPWQYRA